MGVLRRGENPKKAQPLAALSVQSGRRDGVSLSRFSCPAPGERALYRQLREHVPIIDAAIYKLRRLIGSFTVECADPAAQEAVKEFLAHVQVGATGCGADEFIGTYLEELLTYGTAVGEMVVSGGEICALYNANLNDLALEEDGPLGVKVSAVRPGGKQECPYPELLLVSALNPSAGSLWGTSLLRGLPFVSEILLKIYRTLGVNWDRMGNVRFAVTCKPESLGGFPAAERAKQMAEEWRRAMRSPELSDFVAVGDVSIKAIGADGQTLDSSVPVRQMLEQIVAKLGLPPFLLGLSWSSTERMSSQQADVLTSELEAYRRLLTPVVRKIAAMYLTLRGYPAQCRVEWDDITMQDEVDHANARYLTARAREIEEQLQEKERA